MNNFDAAISKVLDSILANQESEARRIFNEQAVPLFDPTYLDDDKRICFYDLERYLNDERLRLLRAPVTTRDYIIFNYITRH